MLPNVIRLQMHNNEPIVMLQKKHHTLPTVTLLQIVFLQQMIYIYSVLLDLGIWYLPTPTVGPIHHTIGPIARR